MATPPVRPTRETFAKSAALYAGLAIYLFSFWLKAVGDLSGWECAMWSLMVRAHDEKLSSLAMFGGYLNLELLLFLVLLPFKSLRRPRAFLEVFILFSIPMTWVAMYRMDLKGMRMDIQIGHVLWIVGILLMVLPRFLTDLSYREVKIGVQWREDQREDTIDLTCLQSDCYRTISVTLHKPELCEHVKSAGVDKLVGSLVTQYKCRRERYKGGTALPLDGQSFVRYMRSIGIDDNQLAALLYRGRPDTYLLPILDKLRDDPTFLPRLQAAPNFNKSAGEAKRQAPQPLEFVYEMAGIEWDLPALCRKISPEAYGHNPGEPGFSDFLGANCFSGVAVNRRDDSLCLTAAHFYQQPYQAIFLKGCLQNVAAGRVRKANRLSYHNAPGIFPTWAEFLAAMGQLGYPENAEWLQLPKPPEEEYGYYLAKLDWEGALERKEFVRRVLAIP